MPGSPRQEIVSIIDGRPVPANAAATRLPIVDPATERQLAVLVEADASEVDAAVRAARTAFDEGPWPRMTVEERRRLLLNARSVLLENAAELAWLECSNSGLPIRDVRERHIPRMARNFEYYADLVDTEAGEFYEQTAGYLTLVGRQPAGVAALLAPWNAPLALASMKVACAVATGNTCVLKPSEYTALSLFRFVELLHEAGVPPGVVNLVNGRGPVTGEALAAHPGVDRIAFTGGTETGRRIMASASANLTPVMLELGGKSANIVFETADLEKALDGALLGIFSNNGQQCLAGSRILVQRPVADTFIERFVARAEALRVGDPTDPDTDIGPLAYERHFRRVLSYADVARDEGARVLTGGVRLGRTGFYMQPTAVLADPGSRVSREEIFGPFAAFHVFDTEEQAVALANDSPYGLVAYVWSEELATALRVREGLRTGTVWINTPLMREIRAPFGGYGDSGIGRSGGREGLAFYTETKVTTVAFRAGALRRLGRDPDEAD
ncbi:MAG: aldehyde dehydrogenase [Gammaproteobacteria bacterium]